LDCSDPTFTKFIAVNIHFMLKSNGKGNFNQFDDGDGDTEYNGYVRAEALIKGCNDELAAIPPIWRNRTNAALLPKRYRYVLKGVYFHNDDQYFSSGNVEGMEATYGVNNNTEINYFINNIPGAGLNGRANTAGGPYKFAYQSDYIAYIKYKTVWHNQYEVSQFSSLINHEIGHTLQLYHTWEASDECDDTVLADIDPDCSCRRQCNDYGDPPGNFCTNWDHISNNLMDYSSFVPRSLTPCQIERIHNDLDNDGHDYVYTCNKDCCFPVVSLFDLIGCFKVFPQPQPSPVHDPFSINEQDLPLYLEGTASSNEDAFYIDIFEVNSLVSQTPLYGTRLRTGRLNGQVGKINLKDLYYFRPNAFYRVILKVESKSCSTPSDTKEKSFYMGEGQCPIPLHKRKNIKSNADNAQLSIYPNPVKDNLFVKYSLSIDSEVKVSIFDNLGKLIIESSFDDESMGEKNHEIDLTGMNNGVYHIVLSIDGFKQSKSFVITH
jgi:hypothetical protein